MKRQYVQVQLYIVSWFHCSYVIHFTHIVKEVEAKVEKFYSSIKSRLLVSEVVARIQVFSQFIKKSNFHVFLSKGWG